MHRNYIIAFVIFLAVTAAYAQVPTSGNIYGGFSYVNADLISGNRNSLNGWNGSLEGKVFPFVGMVADFSGNYGSQTVPVLISPPACPVGVIIPCLPVNGTVSMSLHQHNFLFGPRVSFSAGKVRPFAHALFGASHLTENESGTSSSANSFAYAVGGGIDYRLMHFIGWRIQADMLQTRFFSTTQSDFRLSTGLVFRF